MKPEKSRPHLKILEEIALMVAVLLFVFWAGPLMAKTIRWDMPNEYPATSLHGENDSYFSKVLNEESKGKIVITHHFGASLGYKSKDQFDAVSDQAIPIANTYVGPLRGIDPIFLLSSLPFMSKTIDEAKILWEVSKPYYEKVLKKYNQILLYASPWPSSGIWANKPVVQKSDLINLKIRTYDPNGTITFKNIGAAPIQLSWSDIVPQLGTGGIDAVLTSAEGGISSKFWDLLSDFTEINYSAPLNIIHMNLDEYESLSDELKVALERAVKKASDHAWDAAKKRVKNNYIELKSRNVTVTTEAPVSFLEQLSDAGKEAVSEWKEKMGPASEKILTDYYKAISEK